MTNYEEALRRLDWMTEKLEKEWATSVAPPPDGSPLAMYRNLRSEVVKMASEEGSDSHRLLMKDFVLGNNPLDIDYDIPFGFCCIRHAEVPEPCTAQS